MSHTSITISAPVSMTDISAVLGVSVLQLKYLCRNSNHGQIKKWSRFKPVIIDKMDVRIATDNITVNNPVTGSAITVPGYYGNMTKTTMTAGSYTLNCYNICGLVIPTYSGTFDISSPTVLVTIMDALANNGEGWTYTGPESSYCRQLDFEGYDHSVTMPLTYWVKEKVYNGQQAQVACYRETTTTSVDITSILNTFFTGCYCYAAIVSSGVVEEVIQIGSFENDIDQFAIGTKTYSSNATHKVYFFAYHPTSKYAVFLPNDTEAPNPMTFASSSASDPTDYTTNPFAGLTYYLYDSSMGFAYNITSTFWESFTNVGEGENTYLVTSGQYTLKMAVKNNTSKTITVDLTKLTFRWYAWAKSGKTYAQLNYSAFNASQAQVTGSVTIAAGAEYTFYFCMSNVFYDGANSYSYTATEGTQYGEMDQAGLYYNGTLVQDFNITVLYYKSTNVGKFWNSTRGYFASR